MSRRKQAKPIRHLDDEESTPINGKTKRHSRLAIGILLFINFWSVVLFFNDVDKTNNRKSME